MASLLGQLSGALAQVTQLLFEVVGLAALPHRFFELPLYPAALTVYLLLLIAVAQLIPGNVLGALPGVGHRVAQPRPAHLPGDGPLLLAQLPCLVGQDGLALF